MKQSEKPKFTPVYPDDLKPAHRWRRPLQAPGITQVDFEERVDFKRLHRYRLARTRQSFAKSGFGAMLCFDQHNIRHISSSVIGEWARDKPIGYTLLTGAKVGLLEAAAKEIKDILVKEGVAGMPPGLDVFEPGDAPRSPDWP